MKQRSKLVTISGDEIDSESNPIRLECVLGLTTLNNACLASSSSSSGSTSFIFYSSGCIVVKYSVEDDCQTGFFKVNKAVSCLSVCTEDKYLAIGERGHLPLITVWDIVQNKKICALSVHKHGVGAISFSPNLRYMVSIGFKHDRQLVLWDWKSQTKLSIQKLSNKVNSVNFDHSGDYFVTAGDRHLKWWNVIDVIEGESVALEGVPASILEDQRNSVFMDVLNGSNSTDNFVFTCTSSGVLCVFNESKMVDKWVQLESQASFCIELFSESGTPGLLLVGCANGTIRCFSPSSLEYLATLPMPNKLSESTNDVDATYPACYALKKIPANKKSSVPKLAAIYADRSFIVWDISDIYDIISVRSFQFHRTCVWDIQFIEKFLSSNNDSNNKSKAKALLNNNANVTNNYKPSFVTCSADNTIKVWGPSEMESKKSYSSRISMLHSFDLSENTENELFKYNESMNKSVALNSSGISPTSNSSMDYSSFVPDTELPDRPQSTYSPRTIAIHPYGHQIACGDRTGKIRIIDLSTLEQVKLIQAHAAEVLTLHYSPPLSHTEDDSWTANPEKSVDSNQTEESPLVLLASAGRDRLVHLFNASTQYSAVTTLDNHSSSVTIVKFTMDGKRLLSCGGDKTMVFSSVDGPTITRMKSIQTPQGTINGLAVEATNKFVLTSGQDKRMNIYNVQTGKHMRTYKNESISTAELYKSDIDPSGMYVATCAFDKNITLLDFFSGETVAQVSGHSELITGIKFSPDGQYLITTGGDGCIMMWKLGNTLVKTMQDRIMELYVNAQKRNEKATSKQSASIPPSIPSITNNDMPNNNDPNSNIKPKNQWASRIDPKGGYELFGQKIQLENNKNKNKFTLELTENDVIHDDADIINDSQNSIKASIVEKQGIAEINKADFSTLSPNRLASSLEAHDDVMISGISDDEDDDKYSKALFKEQTADEDNYQSDFENEDNIPSNGGNSTQQNGEVDLKQVHIHLDVLEKSAQDLENWLEDMLRSDTKLDQSVSSSLAKPPLVIPADSSIASDGRSTVQPVISDVDKQSNESSYLDRSLSSEFFKNLRNGNKQSISKDAILPPPPVRRTAAMGGNETAEGLRLESKRRETAASVAQMKERLRQMGVLEATHSNIPIISDPNLLANDLEYKRLNEVDPNFIMPNNNNNSPFKNKNVINNYDNIIPNEINNEPIEKGGNDNYDDDTSSNHSEEVNVTKDSSNKSDQKLLNPINIANELQLKASNYRAILSELEIAKAKAAQSFQELLQLRASLDESVRHSVDYKLKEISNNNESDHLSHSIAETDQLLGLFRQSFVNLSDTISYQSKNLSNSSSQSPLLSELLNDNKRNNSNNSLALPAMDQSGTSESLEVSMILEKYSNRLVEMHMQRLDVIIIMRPLRDVGLMFDPFHR
eukprot:gene5454-7548_t